MAKHSGTSKPCDAVNYTSTDADADFKRFQDAVRHIVNVPKEEVDKAIAEEHEERVNERKGRGK